MSRCFPFPPPGYEKKARTDDDDLIKKEKHGEKKHKKEKKDKEEREGKEKREKDRSDGKHRDKKDRKEKHREKKKDKEKERDKDKDKISTSEEKRIAGLSESCNGEKVIQKERERYKDKSSVSDDKKQILQLQGHSGQKPIRNCLLAEGTGDSKFVQELGRRIRDEEKVSGSQLVERLPVKERKNDERMDRVVVKDTGILAGGKEKNKDKSVDNRKINGQGIRDDAISSGGAVAQNNAGMVQPGVEGMPRSMEKNIERRTEEKEKSKQREGDDKRGDKRKNKDAEKKSHGKDKEREKEKKKEEKSEHKNEDQYKFKDSNKNDNLGTQKIKTSHVAKDGDRNTDVKGNVKKRKDHEANGFLHDSDVRPNKIPRPSTHPSTENGRKLEPCLTSILFTSDRHRQPNNLKVDNKEHKVNGVIEAQPLSISSKKLTSASTQADEIAQASMKTPHRDSKYLSQVLSVPKMEEWSDFDDQEWLFSSKGCPAEKPSVESAETLRVWAEALQIESADVCALPYVIPY